MKPEILDKIIDINSSKENNLTSFDKGQRELKNSNIGIDDIKKLIDNVKALLDHVENGSIHMSLKEKARFSEILDTYTSYENLYVSENDRINWNGKETPDGAQKKADTVQKNLNKHLYNDDIHVTRQQKTNWEDKYTREEIDNKISWIIYDTNYLDMVMTYKDIATTYPNPIIKDTVYVMDTGITYRYNGIKWVAICINLIPLASKDLDGRMSKYDKIKLDGMEDGANKYVHPDNKNTRHVTEDQINEWTNGKINKTDVLAYSGTFNSVLGVRVPHTLGKNTEYVVNISLTSYSNNIGSYWVEKNDNSITVFCSGNSTYDTFDLTLTKK